MGSIPVRTSYPLSTRLVAAGLLSCLLLAFGLGWFHTGAQAQTRIAHVGISNAAKNVSLSARETHRARTQSSQRKGGDARMAPASSNHALLRHCGLAAWASTRLSQQACAGANSARSPPFLG